MTTKQKTARYRVTPTMTGCTLHLSDGYSQDGDGSSAHEFWAPMDGGYVREVSGSRPGTTGRQVCDTLFGLGGTRASTPERLPALIRRLARRHCDAVDRGEL